jgi:hypothetical protein
MSLRKELIKYGTSRLNYGVSVDYFSQVRDIAKTLGANPLLALSDFYLAFSMLDQGLDQRPLGRHGSDEKKLLQAITLLENV